MAVKQYLADFQVRWPPGFLLHGHGELATMEADDEERGMSRVAAEGCLK
jgi:hypothetical protein